MKRETLEDLVDAIFNFAEAKIPSKAAVSVLELVRGVIKTFLIDKLLEYLQAQGFQIQKFNAQQF